MVRLAARQPARNLQRRQAPDRRRAQLDARRSPGAAGEAAGDRARRTAAPGMADAAGWHPGCSRRADRGLQLAQPGLPGALSLRAGTAVGLLHRLRTRRLHARSSEEHTSELQSLMRISYAVFCLK